MRAPLIAFAVAAAAVAFASGSASAQVAAVPMTGQVPNREEVSLSAGPDSALYLTGLFDRLAKRSGHGAQFDAAGTPAVAWPDVDGDVHASVPDGAGGWFIGGEFSHVAGLPRAGLAHLGSNGELDPTWAPAAYAPRRSLEDTVTVQALGVVGDVVYVGGSFTQIDG